jgi:zinc transport system substrate-binding protein
MNSRYSKPISLGSGWMLAVFLSCSIWLGATMGCDRDQGSETPSSTASARPESQEADAQETAGTPATGAMTERGLQVYTTFYPTEYFATRIGGDRVEVVCPCPADADPASWMPPADVVAQYQKADLIVVNGAGFEKWVGAVTLPVARVVDTARPFADEFITLEGAVTHSHGEGGTHSHAGLDGHTWLDPRLARRQAGEILAGLAKADPEHEGDYQEGFRGLADDLAALDQRLSELPTPEWTILTAHPAYNYLARRYGWEVKYFFFDPEEMPSAENLEEVRDYVDKHGSRVMIWEGTPSEEVATAFAALGLTNVVFSPGEALGAEDRAAGADYLSVMNGNVDRLAAVLAN